MEILDSYHIPYKDNDDFKHLIDNLEIGYICLVNTVYCAHLTFLMKLVITTKKYPMVNNVIWEYLSNNPNEINKVNDIGWSALHLAICSSKDRSTETTVRILISFGADINLKTSESETPILLAIKYHQYVLPQVVGILLDEGADIQQDYVNIIYRLVRYAPENIIKIFLDRNYYLILDNINVISMIYLRFPDFSHPNLFIEDGMDETHLNQTNLNNPDISECTICSEMVWCYRCPYNHLTCSMCLDKNKNGRNCYQCFHPIKF